MLLFAWLQCETGSKRERERTGERERERERAIESSSIHQKIHMAERKKKSDSRKTDDITMDITGRLARSEEGRSVRPISDFAISLIHLWPRVLSSSPVQLSLVPKKKFPALPALSTVWVLYKGSFIQNV